MPLSSAPIRPSLPHSSVTATIPPVAVSEGSAAPIWILPRVLPGVRAASTISVTLLLGQSSTVTLDNPSRTPQPHTLSAACRRSTRGNGSENGGLEPRGVGDWAGRPALIARSIVSRGSRQAASSGSAYPLNPLPSKALRKRARLSEARNHGSLPPLLRATKTHVRPQSSTLISISV